MIKKIVVYFLSGYDRFLLRVEEKTAKNLTTNDRKRRFIVKTGKHEFKSFTSQDIRFLNRVLHKEYSIIDLFEVAESIIEWSSINGEVINFGKRRLR